MSLTIAITQIVKEEQFLKFCKEKGIQLLQIPQIRFETVDFEIPLADSFDVIFFSSKRSVSSFFRRATVAPHHLIACIGESTAQVLKNHVPQVHFIGKKSGRPAEVAEDFKVFVGSKKVLFPQSQVSNRSMQKELPKAQVIDVITYHTFSAPKKVEEKVDYLIFTSPSNVEAFLLLNKINPTSKLISWGETTTKRLLNHHIQPEITLEESSFEELMEVLNNLI